MHADYEDGVLELPDGKELTPGNLCKHAETVIQGRWPEAEPIIMEDPHCARWYAKYVIKGRWPEAEPIIMESQLQAYWYADDVIKGRWPEAEPTIRKSPVIWRDYCELFGISE